MAAAIEVLAIRKLDGRSTVKAFCDIQVGALKISGCKIVQQDNQRAWVAMPSIKSERAWNNVIEITSKDLKQRIADVVLAAWNAQRQEIIPPERPPAHQAQRGVATGQAIAERAARHDPGQHDTGDPGRPFDDEVPW